MAGTSEVAEAVGAVGSRELLEKLSPGPGMSPAEVAEHQRARVHNAVVEIVGERGCEALTMREISRLSGVSSRAFYQHYESKEECFLRTHEEVVRSVVRSMFAAQAGREEWSDRLGATFDAFAGELVREPRIARLLLVEAYSAGPEAISQVRRAERTFEARIADCFLGSEDSIKVSSLLTKAIASGMLHLARSRLLGRPKTEPGELSGPLTEWAGFLHRESASGAAALDRQVEDEWGSPEGPPASPSKHGQGMQDPAGDRALILNAVAKLVLCDGYRGLAIPSICLAAGLSKRRFHLQYTSIDECFVDATELCLARALDRAEEAASTGGATQEQRAERALLSLCDSVASDKALQRLGFAEVLCPGPRGFTTCARAVERVRGLIAGPETDGRVDVDAFTEASAGGIWGLLGHFATDAGGWQPAQAAGALALVARARSMTVVSGPAG